MLVKLYTDERDRNRIQSLLIKELSRYTKGIEFTIFAEYMFKYQFIDRSSLIYFCDDLVNEKYVVIYKLKKDEIKPQRLGPYMVDWVVNSERFIKLTFRGLRNMIK